MVVIVQHRVSDYEAWKTVFDEHEEVRRRHGATGHELYRGLDDPNEVTVVNHFPSRAAGEALVADPSLKEAMERGGVVSEPRVTWAEEANSAEYTTKAA
jgi:quinol monooxygenase YgiN